MQIVAAALISLGVIVGGYFNGGRYAIIQSNNIIYTIDRLTGAIAACNPDICRFPSWPSTPPTP